MSGPGSELNEVIYQETAWFFVHSTKFRWLYCKRWVLTLSKSYPDYKIMGVIKITWLADEACTAQFLRFEALWWNYLPVILSRSESTGRWLKNQQWIRARWFPALPWVRFSNLGLTEAELIGFDPSSLCSWVIRPARRYNKECQRNRLPQTWLNRTRWGEWRSSTLLTLKQPSITHHRSRFDQNYHPY